MKPAEFSREVGECWGRLCGSSWLLVETECPPFFPREVCEAIDTLADRASVITNVIGDLRPYEALIDEWKMHQAAFDSSVPNRLVEVAVARGEILIQPSAHSFVIAILKSFLGRVRWHERRDGRGRFPVPIRLDADPASGLTDCAYDQLSARISAMLTQERAAVSLSLEAQNGVSNVVRIDGTVDREKTSQDVQRQTSTEYRRKQTIERICNALSGQSLKLFSFLMTRVHWTNFSTIRDEAKQLGFRVDCPDDNTITIALKRLRNRLADEPVAFTIRDGKVSRLDWPQMN